MPKWWNAVSMGSVKEVMGKRAAVLVLIFFAVACTPGSTPEPDPASETVVSASYEVFPPVVPFGDTPEAIFRNLGNVTLEYGNAYTLERFVEGTWVELEQPSGAETLCAHTGEAYLLDPGSSKSQEIGLCDFYGEMHPLAPGDYRVTKTARTGASTPDLSIEEVTEVASFDVAAPMGDVARPSECEVLCLSDTEMRVGDIVTVTFDPPYRFIWGARSELHAGSEKTATPIALLVGWQERDEELITYWPEDGGSIEDIGFGGRGSWEWGVPRRLEPGIYAIVKEGIRGGSAPVPDRRRFWAVAFEVLG